MSKLLGTYILGKVLEYDMPTIKIIEVYDDCIILELHSLRFYHRDSLNSETTKFVTKKCRKKIDYRDAILMNETLNKIMGPKK